MLGALRNPAMARKRRVEFSGACYHVLNRGNYRSDLFRAPGASASFQGCLFEACQRFAWRLHAFVIMRNHFHLALETPEPNLSLGMKWLQGTWAMRFNRFQGETGQPFQGRYRGLHVEPGAALARVADYIHLNPARAGVLPVARLPDYRGSSLGLYLATARPPCLEPATLLRFAGDLSDNASGWRCYLQHLARVAGIEAKAGADGRGRLSSGWTIGSAAFRGEVHARLAAQVDLERRFGLLGADREAHVAAREGLWEERLQALASSQAIDLRALPAGKSAREKVQLAVSLRRETSVSNRWLATRLQLGSESGVSSLLHRYEKGQGRPKTVPPAA